MGEGRSRSFYLLSFVFALYVLFLYGPTITIVVLSFQGPNGGMTFPMNGVSLHWFRNLWAVVGVPFVVGALVSSLELVAVVAVLSAVIALMARLAVLGAFRGPSILLFTVVAGVLLPAIVVFLGFALVFHSIDKRV